MIKSNDWEEIGVTKGDSPVLRLKVIGGWIVHLGGGCLFFPDPEHEWDGSSLK